MIEQFLERGVWMKNNEMIVPDWSHDAHKDQFIKVVGRRVQLLDKSRYLKATGSSQTLAEFRGLTNPIPGGRLIENVGVYVNKDMFMVTKQDFSDVIPVTVHDQIYQFWLRVNGIHSDDFVGKLSLNEKFKFALSIGKADRYLQFIFKLHRMGHPKFTKNTFQENHTAYHEARQLPLV